MSFRWYYPDQVRPVFLRTTVCHVSLSDVYPVSWENDGITPKREHNGESCRTPGCFVHRSYLDLRIFSLRQAPLLLPGQRTGLRVSVVVVLKRGASVQGDKW